MCSCDHPCPFALSVYVPCRDTSLVTTCNVCVGVFVGVGGVGVWGCGGVGVGVGGCGLSSPVSCRGMKKQQDQDTRVGQQHGRRRSWVLMPTVRSDWSR